MTVLFLFPLSVVILVPLTFIISYSISVALKHVEPGFPYISDTGTYPPESCIFGQLLNISAVLMGISVYIRYRQAVEYHREGPYSLLILNKIALALGLIASAGVSLVANFQETSVITVHLIGALLAFGLGIVYAWLQLFMTYRMCPELRRIPVFAARLLISVTATLCFLEAFIAAAIASKQFDGDDPTKWYPEDGGWPAHVVSTACEWVMAVAFMCYFATYIFEFRKIDMTAPHVYIVEDVLPLPIDPNDDNRYGSMS